MTEELPSALAWATMHQGSTLSDMLALTSHKAERAHSLHQAYDSPQRIQVLRQWHTLRCGQK